MNWDINWQNYLPELEGLRHELHAHPELSGEEVETRKRLIRFIQEHAENTVTIHDLGSWFYVYQPGEGATETIAIRADHDAILGEDGQAFHGCGHDGHSTILAGLVWLMSQRTSKVNIVYVFQHAEENGQGAAEIVDHLVALGVNHIYGLHNFPGQPLNHVFTRPGTIMCASRGMSLNFKGHQTHAAQPEKGLNPAYAIAELVKQLEELVHFSGYQGKEWRGIHFADMVLVTIVSMAVGEPDHFGVSPAHGQVQLTLRAAKLDDLDRLAQKIESLAQDSLTKWPLDLEIEYTDAFPDTDNNPDEVQFIAETLKNSAHPLGHLEEPFRPSEDFGWYLKQISGCFIGLGSGEQHPDLHLATYDFPDAIIPTGIEVFGRIICAHEKEAN
ncbi:M20 metallopeptidase family protein [Vaginisenegalia massiliensis]|uniref:M20 metallopeptidase family protein n=1 Tax=Vaginisenegalia massiliensis TaxID=2058294 RepID=UPI000F52532F|nr:amidohydrolase [Vaginisenegalia massiliensis]